MQEERKNDNQHFSAWCKENVHVWQHSSPICSRIGEQTENVKHRGRHFHSIFREVSSSSSLFPNSFYTFSQRNGSSYGRLTVESRCEVFMARNVASHARHFKTQTLRYYDSLRWRLPLWDKGLTALITMSRAMFARTELKSRRSSRREYYDEKVATRQLWFFR